MDAANEDEAGQEEEEHDQAGHNDVNDPSRHAREPTWFFPLAVFAISMGIGSRIIATLVRSTLDFGNEFRWAFPGVIDALRDREFGVKDHMGRVFLVFVVVGVVVVVAAVVLGFLLLFFVVVQLLVVLVQPLA